MAKKIYRNKCNIVKFHKIINYIVNQFNKYIWMYLKNKLKLYF